MDTDAVSLDSATVPGDRSYGASSLIDLFERLDDDGSPLPDYFLELNHLRRSYSAPLILSFDDLTYTVKSTESKTLLQSVSGAAREGEILAVLGASGSGKTTLIDGLADRIPRRDLRGSITLNGEHVDSHLIKSISSYVRQHDLLYPLLTVEETLLFSAEFRLPRSLSSSAKRRRVRALMRQLDLQDVAASLIGNEGRRGISGGERRRVSIGVDIVHDPLLLFLDEPTSGLDSTSAFNVVKVLQGIARSGSVVIIAIHQPNARILDLLDELLILSIGQVVYAGKPMGLQPFFSFFGNPIPENENHAEFALDLVQELETPPNDTCPLVEFHRSWQRNAAKLRDLRGYMPLKEVISTSMSHGKLIISDRKEFVNPWWREVWMLSKRSFANARRMPEVFAVRFAVVVVTGLVLASLFWRLERSPEGVKERLGFFAITMSTTYYISAEALSFFHEEKEIFMRETAYNAYRRSSYVLSNAMVSFPSITFLSLAFAATTFFAPNLEGGLAGFFFYFVTTLAAFWAGLSFVTFLSSVVPVGRMGFTIIMGVLAYYLLLSGIFITKDRIPTYWLWLHYLSLITYPYKAMLQNEFNDPKRCFVRGVQLFDYSPLGELPTVQKEALLKEMGSAMGMNVSRSTCFVTGLDVLRQQGVRDMGKWECVGVLVAWGFLFRMLFYLVLLFSSKNKRH